MNSGVFQTVLLLGALLAVMPAQSQHCADTLDIRFRLDSIRIDMAFAGNADAWASFERNYYDHYSDVQPRELRLDIYSGASPEGTPSHNRWLGENRGQAIRRLVRQRLPGRIGSIVVHNEAARWDAFYESVEASDEPWRDDVLAILDLPASADENRWDHREYKLRALHGGTVWPTLLNRYLAPLRSGSTAILSWVRQRDTLVVTAPAAPCPDLPAAPVSQDPPAPRPLRYPVWILRTNLPLLATGTPNLQAEWSLGHRDRWSLNVEGVWSWWTFAWNEYANEIIYGSVELRYWLGRRWRHHTLSGWHIGLGLGGGYGDIEWKSRGVQAEVYSAFVNIGWQHRFGRRRQWAFDAGVGLGYAYIPWRRYTGSRLFPKGHEEPHTDHLMWRETGRNHWIGTPHFNVSLGYVFPQRDARWRRMKAVERDIERGDYLFFRDSLNARQRYVADSLHTERRYGTQTDTLPATKRQALRMERLQVRADAERQRNQDAYLRRMEKARERYQQTKEQR